MNLISEWLVSLGQCLVCGGRGGYPGMGARVVLCQRCQGTGKDPDRGLGWYADVVLPVQASAIKKIELRRQGDAR